jgi:cytochrome d ubiquinol oxidase subunit I
MTRKGTVPKSKWLMRLALLGILAPFAASAAGWVFTEMGRQPFVVAPNPTPGGIDGVFMFTASAVSPGVEPWEMIVSLVALTLVYLALLVVEVGLLWKYARAGVAGVMPELDESHDDTDKTDDVLAFAY